MDIIDMDTSFAQPDADAEATQLDRIEAKLDQIIDTLAPVGPALERLPELMESVGPALDSLSKSPLLKMLGIK